MRRNWVIVAAFAVLLLAAVGGVSAQDDDWINDLEATSDARLEADQDAGLRRRVDDLEDEVEDLKYDLDRLSTRVARID